MLHVRYRTIAAIVTMAVACLAAQQRALCIGLMNPDDVYDWNTPPADLPHPPSTVVARICDNVNYNVRGSGVVIQPNWVLTAKHLGINCEISNRAVDVEGVIYNIAACYNHPEADHTLLRLEDANGQPADLPDFVGLSLNALPGTIVTIGGYGRTYVSYDPETGNPDAQGVAGLLRWGRNVLTTTGGFLAELVGKPGHVKYEGIGLMWDSGGGIFVKNHLGWQLVSNFRTSGGGPTAAYSYDWIIETINNDPNSPDYTPPAIQWPPIPDSWWTGDRGRDWSNTLNWTDGIPDANCTVLLDDSGAGPKIGSDAEMLDLCIGGSTGQGVVTQSDGIVTIYDNMYSGAAGGQYLINGGQLNVANQFIGLDGPGLLSIKNGQVFCEGMTCIGRGTNGQGVCSLKGSSSEMSTITMVLAADPGSSGLLEIQDGALTAMSIIVGYLGAGTVEQSAGTVTAEKLDLGERFAAELTATYSLSEGLINAGKLNINGGSFTNSGGQLNVSGEMPLRSRCSFSQTDGNSSIGVLRVTNGAGPAYFELVAGEMKTGRLLLGVDPIYCTGVFTQSGGTHNIGSLEMHDPNCIYILNQGVLNITELASVSGGILECQNSSASEVNLAGWVDLSGATFVGMENTTINLDTTSLLILPPDVNADSFGGLTGDGIICNSGSGICIPAGKCVTARHEVLVTENLEIEQGGLLNCNEDAKIRLSGGLTVHDGSDLQLNGGSIDIPDKGSLVDLGQSVLLCDYFWVAKNGGLTANGTIDPDRHMVCEGTLNIGPDIAELEILAEDPNTGWCVLLNCEIEFDIAGLYAGQYDRLSIIAEDMVMAAELKINFLNDFVPMPGDELVVIDYRFVDSRQAEPIASHNGPVGLVVDPVLDDQAGTVTLAFSAACEGDLNLDGQVNVVDLNMILIGWGQSSQIDDPRADVNRDGFVDVYDLNFVLVDWGWTLAGQASKEAESSQIITASVEDFLQSH